MNKTACPLLLYHGVAECAGDAVRDPLYAVPEAALLAQVGWLRSEGRRTVSLAEFLSREGECGGACVVTVDDGLESAATRLFPVLAQAGFTATVLVVAGMVGRRGWVSWGQLDEMRGAGFEIGSHGLTHRNLAEASPEAARREMGESKRRIEDRIGAPVRFFSLPGGYRGGRTADLAREAGYDAVLGSRFGYNRVPPERSDLKRFCLRGSDGPETVRRIMEGSWGLLPRYAREGGTVLARRILRGRLYAAVRNRLIPPGAHRTLPHFPEDG